MITLLKNKNHKNIILPGEEISINADKLEVPVENVLRNLGMQLSDADEYLLDLIEEARETCFSVVRPKACYAFTDRIDLQTERQKAILNNLEFETGKLVTGFLKRSEKIVVFVCTIGDEVEKMSKQLMANGDALEGYIYDILGSEMAECVADELHNYIDEVAKKDGFNVSNRYSPGYCNWPVSDQHKLFSLLSNTCGVSLTESSLMLPVKSVSGILGVGRNMKRLKYKCDICKDKNCIMRKKF